MSLDTVLTCISSSFQHTMNNLPPELVEKILHHVLFLSNSSAQLAFHYVYSYPQPGPDFELQRHAGCLLTCSLWHELGLPHLLETICTENGHLPGLREMLMRRPALVQRISRIFIGYQDNIPFRWDDFVWSMMAPASAYVNLQVIGISFPKDFSATPIQSGVYIYNFFAQRTPKIAFVNLPGHLVEHTRHLRSLFASWMRGDLALHALYIDLPPGFGLENLPSLPRVSHLHILGIITVQTKYRKIYDLVVRYPTINTVWIHHSYRHTSQGANPARANRSMPEIRNGRLLDAKPKIKLVPEMETWMVSWMGNE